MAPRPSIHPSRAIIGRDRRDLALTLLSDAPIIARFRMFEPFTEDAIRAIERARTESRRLEFAQVLPEHLLLGLLGEQRATAVKVLATLGVDWRRLRHQVESRLGRGY